MIREAARSEEIKPAEFVYRFEFMAAEHNYLCAVCRDDKAVLVCHEGVLQPCWSCQKKGYSLIKRGRFSKWFHTIFP